jgi:predicted DNA-binding protein (MmcQ/YjbR family)
VGTDATPVERAVERLRRYCAPFGHVQERSSFGHPALRVRGRPFAVLDRYAGSDCLWLYVAPADRARLLATRGWFAAPYDPRHKALCVRLDAIDWRRMRALLRVSYALAISR